MKYYIVSFDRAAGRSYDAFHREFVAHRGISKWSHYIKSSYLIGTVMSASEVSKHFRAVALAQGIPTRHLVMRVSLDDRAGWLPSGAWEWIGKQSEAPQ